MRDAKVWWWFALAMTLLGWHGGQGSAQELHERQIVRSGTKEVRLRYRLMVTGRFTPAGLRVATVAPNGPGAFLFQGAGAQRKRGILEKGDLITRINGIPVTSPEAYARALNQTGAEEVAVLSIREPSTGRDADWSARAVKVQLVKAPRARELPLGAARAVKVLCVADTDDRSIGRMIATGLEPLGDRLVDTPRLKQEDLYLLSGGDVTPQNILAAIDALQVGPDETLLYYHIGHGAYDPDRAQGDPSGGHFFAMGPRGDLLRKTVRERLLAKKAQLTVLISDTCNARATANPVAAARQLLEDDVGENRVLGNLLLQHRGVIDISGSSTNQYGWFSGDIGGWFTKSLVDASALDQFADTRFVSWDLFVQSCSDRTSRLFMARKQAILEQSGGTNAETLDQLRKQPDQRPQVFVSRVEVIQ